MSIRNTRQRQVILEELRNCRLHPTTADLYDRVRRRLPHISLGTVYRNLERLVDTGLARKLDFAGTTARYDGKLDRHYHVRCQNCRRIDDVAPADYNPPALRPGNLNGYKILDHRLEFIGICKSCQQTIALRQKAPRGSGGK